MGKKTKRDPKFDDENRVLDEDGTELWVVDAILGKRVTSGKNYYFVKWKGYPMSQASWEPEENVIHMEEMIRKFEKGHEKNVQVFKKPLPPSERSKKIKKIPKSEGSISKTKHTRNRMDSLETIEEETDEQYDSDSLVDKSDSQFQLPQEKSSLNKKQKKDEENMMKELGIYNKDARYGDISHDVAVKITDHKTFETQNTPAPLFNYLFKVEWKNDKKGKSLTPVYYSYNIVKEKLPRLLLDYLEKIIK